MMTRRHAAAHGSSRARELPRGRALSVPEGLAKLDGEGPFDAVLTDLRMPGASGLDLLKVVRDRDPNAIVVVLTAFGDAGTAGDAIRAGAHDFISKPYDIGELRLVLSRALERRRLQPTRAEAAAGNAARELDVDLVGHSPSIIGVMKTVARIAPSQASVLIFGETGTGKELVARTVHRYSERASARFVAVNCSALAEGPARERAVRSRAWSVHGSAVLATGPVPRGGSWHSAAGRDRRYLGGAAVQTAQGAAGTGNCPGGAETPIRVDVRIIAATHRDLAALVKEGRFREDLYYRLNVVTITLPPLRERRQDIPLLIDNLLRRLSTKHDRGPVAVDPEAQRALLAYDWPGNVRELHNVLERALVLASQDVIGPEHLPREVRATLAPHAGPAGQGDTRARAEMVPLSAIEQRHVLAVLAASDGNRERAARVLQISRRTLSRMLQRWGMSTPRS